MSLSIQNQPDDELPVSTAIARLAGGELRDAPAREAWSIVESAWPELERFVLARLDREKLSPQRCADCGQNVFVRFWRFRTSYRGSTEAEFWTWLRSICDNERRRLQWRERHDGAVVALPSSGEGAAESGGGDADPAMEVSNDEVLDALRVCLAALPDKHRQVTELAFLSPQLSERAIAVLLGLSASRIHKIKVEALSQLGRCLGNRGIER